MGKKTAASKPASRLGQFPDSIYITRVDEDGSHYFLAHQDVTDVPDDAGDVVVYERRTLGTVLTEKSFVREDA